MIGSVWEHTLPVGLRVARAPLDGPAEADVCIVGAGLTGLWSAYHLLRQRPSLKVYVLDAAEVGFGASGRNGGWCSALFPLGERSMAARHGRDAAIAMKQACRQVVDDVLATAAAEDIPIAAAKGGTVSFARHRAGMRSAAAEVAEAAEFGVSPLELLDQAGLADHITVAGARGGTWTPDCARVHPGALVHGVAAAVERRGGVIAEGTRATRIEPGVVHTDHGRVRCRHILRATEGFTPWLGGSQAREVVPVYSLVLATPPLPQRVWDDIGLERGQTFSEQQHLVVYGQRTADDRIVFGGRGAPYHFGSSVSAGFEREPAVHAGLARLLLEYFPTLRNRAIGSARLEGLPVEFTWGGALGIPRDWHPSVRYDPTTGIGSAGGYVGDGLALTFLAGQTLADLVLGQPTGRSRLPWVNHVSPPWEPEPWRWLGVNAGLRLARAADTEERLIGRPGLLGKGLAALTGH